MLPQVLKILNLVLVASMAPAYIRNHVAEPLRLSFTWGRRATVCYALEGPSILLRGYDIFILPRRKTKH